MKQNKRVLVTGSSRGIGEAIARRFVREGYEVCLHAGHDVERVTKLAEELGASAFVADFSKAGEVSRLAEEVGAVDVLVNCAGISSWGLFQDLSDAELEEILAIDLKASMLLTRHLLPSMISAHAGAIVNVSSIWGQTGASMEVAYSAAKAGLIGFTTALAKEVAPSGVRVNCVCPGAIDTDMMASFTKDDREALAEMIPLGRIGSAQEVANCVFFLASEGASYVTGQILSPNGGLYM